MIYQDEYNKHIPLSSTEQKLMDAILQSGAVLKRRHDIPKAVKNLQRALTGGAASTTPLICSRFDYEKRNTPEQQRLLASAGKRALLLFPEKKDLEQSSGFNNKILSVRLHERFVLEILEKHPYFAHQNPVEVLEKIDIKRVAREIIETFWIHA